MADAGSKLAFAICVQRFDETSERLRMDFGANAGSDPQQRTSAWQVLISRHVFYWGTDKQLFTFEVVCPPMSVLSTNAPSLWNAQMICVVLRVFGSNV